MMAKKAFQVWAYDNETTIVFADRAVVARREGANDLNCEFESVESCKRVPDFDQYAEAGFVPAEVLIDNGWWFECHGCYRTVNSDAEGTHRAYGRHRTITLKPIYEGSTVWCCPSCKARFEKDQRICAETQDKAIEDMKQRLWRRFPGVEIATDGNWKPRASARKEGRVYGVTQVAVSFHFPGEKIGPATYRYDMGGYWSRDFGPHEPYFNCCGGDKEAFEAWARGDAVPSEGRKAA